MIDRSHVWTGSLNGRALGPLAGAQVGLYDTTLRDGEQTVGVVLAPEEKLEIARSLAEAGVDRIEAGFPRVSQEDWRAVELMIADDLNAELWGFSRAVQAAVAAVRAGASWVHGTINGMGERGGNADLAEAALALEALYGYTTNLRFDRVRGLSAQVKTLSGYDLEPWKPLVGENLFTRESGAVAAQFHDPPSIEPYSSKVVGAARGLVLGKKSGIDSIRIRGEELGIDIDEEARASILAAVKELGVRKGGLVTDAEFVELVAQSTASEQE